jgi:protein-S-isoprenylcysteine O-methyltransferase Ste14
MKSVSTDKSVTRSTPPKSISTIWTVCATLVGATIGCTIVFWWYPELDKRLSALFLMACVFVPGALAEMFVNNAPETSGLDFTWRSMSIARIVRKLAALWVIFALLAVAYASFPVYAEKTYDNFHWLLANFGWLLVLVSIPYVAAVDTFQSDPDDALASWGRQLFSLSFQPTARDINYLLGWVVKGFFLPLMFCYLISNIDSLRQTDFSTYDFLPTYLYDVTYNSLYFVDLLVGAVGYASTLRLLGTEIRSTDPTLMGWVVALACYEPFFGIVGNSYFSYGHDRPWGVILGNSPVLYTIWGMAILFLVFVYVWSTVVFGIRFSNLTNRGIITSGPYRWTKHPAYLAKNASWWLISIPFLPPDGSLVTAVKLCVMLGFVNLIYFLRAKTEERHLSQDPAYREYSEFIEQHGLFSYLRK